MEKKTWISPEITLELIELTEGGVKTLTTEDTTYLT